MEFVFLSYQLLFIRNLVQKKVIINKYNNTSKLKRNRKYFSRSVKTGNNNKIIRNNDYFFTEWMFNTKRGEMFKFINLFYSFSKQELYQTILQYRIHLSIQIFSFMICPILFTILSIIYRLLTYQYQLSIGYKFSPYRFINRIVLFIE